MFNFSNTTSVFNLNLNCCNKCGLVCKCKREYALLLKELCKYCGLRCNNKCSSLLLKKILKCSICNSLNCTSCKLSTINKNENNCNCSECVNKCTGNCACKNGGK